MTIEPGIYKLHWADNTRTVAVVGVDAVGNNWIGDQTRSGTLLMAHVQNSHNKIVGIQRLFAQGGLSGAMYWDDKEPVAAEDPDELDLKKMVESRFSVGDIVIVAGRSGELAVRSWRWDYGNLYLSVDRLKKDGTRSSRGPTELLRASNCYSTGRRIADNKETEK